MMCDDIQALLREDHRKLRHLHTCYKKAPTAEVKQQLVYHIIRLASMHTSAEAEALYPAVRQVMGEGVHSQLLEDDQKVRQALCKLDAIDPYTCTTELDSQVGDVMAVLEARMQHAEQVVLPTLLKDQRCNANDLGVKYRAAEAHTVTRPHPWAPVTHPWDTLAKAVIAPLDRLRDFVRFAGYIPEVASA